MGVIFANNSPIIAIGGGPIGRNAIATKSNDYTLLLFDYAILCNASSGSFSITLPSASTCTGKTYVIKKIDSSSNSVTIAGDVNIDGNLTLVIATQYDSVTVICDGENWFII